MKTMKWLLLREFWEHKGSFFWAPLVIGIVMVVCMGGTLSYAIATHDFSGSMSVNGHSMNQADLINAIPSKEKALLVRMFASGYMAVSAPLFLVLTAIAFFYCLGALYDERRDRSILFWKSLPASDQLTVISKVAAALCVAPLISIAIATATSMLMLLMVCAAAALKGINLVGPLLASPEFYLSPLRLVALLPVYILWALPTVGWLLMVSAWARSKVFLWAVGTPILSIVIIKWLNYLVGGYSENQIDVDWFIHHVVIRGLTSLIPGIWLAAEEVPHALLVHAEHQGIDTSAVFVQSWLTLTRPNVWIGVAAGAAMIYAAMRLRRWREEG
ncbi:MAG: hypothetical protein V4508_14035 [Pseudomonadota bacterium]